MVFDFQSKLIQNLLDSFRLCVTDLLATPNSALLKPNTPGLPTFSRARRQLRHPNRALVSSLLVAFPLIDSG